MWLVSQKACVQGAVLTYTWENYYDVALAGIERSIRYISMILSLFGGILIQKNEKLQSHPYKTLSVMLIIDACNFFQFDLAQDIIRARENLNFPNTSIFSTSLFFSKDSINKYQNFFTGILYCSNAIFSRLFKYTFITINFGITWDLYKSVRSPFDSTNSRHEKIMLFSPLMFVGMFVYWGIH